MIRRFCKSCVFYRRLVCRYGSYHYGYEFKFPWGTCSLHKTIKEENAYNYDEYLKIRKDNNECI